MARRIALFTLACLLVGLCAWRGFGQVAQPKKPDLTTAKYYGVSTCNKCHAEPGKFATDFVLMNEFTIWRTKDKHALAYLMLEGPRGRQIGKILKIDVTTEPQCLNCHAPSPPPGLRDESFNKLDGVSCDVCHGPAEHWLLDHAFKPNVWRVKSPQEKEDLGMYDVRHPLKRTQLCASCHIGSAAEGKVVTHAMYAAGHPPLPSFEPASFSRNMPPHWRDFRDVEFFKKADAKIRKQNYGDDADFQNTRLMLYASTDLLRSFMELVAHRASQHGNVAVERAAWPPVWLKPFAKNEPHDRWPELERKPPNSETLQTLWPEIMMAQGDCYACHHELKSKSWRQIRGYPGKPGRPQLQQWPFALGSVSVGDREFAMHRRTLRDAFDVQPFGASKDVAAAAVGMEASMARFKDLPTTDHERVTKLLKALLTKGSREVLDYDSARQVAWATRTVCDEWKKPRSTNEIDAIFAKLDDELNLTLNANARKRYVNERYTLTKDLASSDKEFAAKAKDQTFLAALQKVRDRELQESLARVRDYDPTVVMNHMKELARLIGEN
jgi:hypothetical protein